MPHECYYCGELKPCRRIFEYTGSQYPPALFPSFIRICKDCDKYRKLKDKKSEREYKIEEEEREKNKRKRFIKKRDKFLKEYRRK